MRRRSMLLGLAAVPITGPTAQDLDDPRLAMSTSAATATKVTVSLEPFSGGSMAFHIGRVDFTHERESVQIVAR